MAHKNSKKSSQPWAAEAYILQNEWLFFIKKKHM